MLSQPYFQSSLKYSLIAASIALAACGGGGGESATPTPTPDPVGETDSSALLIPVKTQEQLLQSFRQGFDQIIQPGADIVSGDVMATAPVAEGSDGSGANSRSFTTTYTLEKSVDEHDAVKYDGSHLFIAPSRSMECCFIVDDIILEDEMMIANETIMLPEDSVMDSDHSIRILVTDPEQAEATQVGSIALDSNRSVEGLYIDDSQLVSINSSGWWGLYGDAFISPRTWQEQSTGLAVYDISDTANPTLDWQIDIEGGFISSRNES